MLVESQLTKDDVVSIKLSSGEELVTRYETCNDNVYRVKHPMLLIARQEGLGLAPFMFSVVPDATFELNVRNVLCIMKTESELAKQYRSQTSGLIL